jgi:ketosteroid isomerase-like protein
MIEFYFDRVDKHDVDALMTVFADDIVYYRPGYEPLRGFERMRSFYADERVIDVGKHSVERILIDGDYAAAHGTFEGVSYAGVALAMTWCEIYGFENHKINYRRSYFFTPANVAI